CHEYRNVVIVLELLSQLQRECERDRFLLNPADTARAAVNSSMSGIQHDGERTIFPTRTGIDGRRLTPVALTRRHSGALGKGSLELARAGGSEDGSHSISVFLRL